MMKFAKKRYITPSGSPIRTTYQLKISTKTGVLELFEKGKEDFNAYIQSFADSCDLTNIIRRINAGELDLLNYAPGTYGDFLNVPESLQDAMNIRLDAKHTWDKLPKDQKAKFADFDDFCATAGTEDWFKKFGVEFKNEKVEESEVKTDAGTEQ